MDFYNINYLKEGNSRQQDAFRVLESLGFPNILQEFDPIFVGTIPLNIDIPGSDLDIICEYKDSQRFKNTLGQVFGSFGNFTLHSYHTIDGEAVVCRFSKGGFPIEIFGLPVPTRTQAGYRHMLIEHQILEQYGDKFREEIIALKIQGFRTEPAFANLLKLDGDPYEALLNFS